MQRSGIRSWGVAVFAMMCLVAQPGAAGEKLRLKVGTFSAHQVQKMGAVSMFGGVAGSATHSTRYQVVQFKSRITAADRSFLKSSGCRILRYLPDDAYLVEMKKSNLQKIVAHSRVNAVVPYVAAFRVSQEFDPVSVFTASRVEKVLVRLLEADHLHGVSQAIQSQRLGEIKYSKGKSLLVELPLKDIRQLSSLEGVEWVEPYKPMKIHSIDSFSEFATNAPNGDFSDLTGFETGTKIMNFQAAWDRGYAGKGQIVAEADTGVDQGKVGSLVADFNNVIKGHTFGLFSDNWSDPMGHGTHVAGSVMGSGALSGGLFMGGAHEASMVAQGMWSDLLQNLTVPPDLSELFDTAYEDGARVHTNSWGNPRALGTYDSMSVQVDEFMWEHPELLIVFAAGNSGVDSDSDGRVDPGSVSSPATAKNALSVGASENYLLSGGIQKQLGELLDGEPWPVEPLASDRLSDDPNGLAGFSSRGPTDDGRIKPDVVAPGTNIVSNCSSVKDASPLWGNYNENYCYSGGTSMSTPLVAGAAAVVRQYLQESFGLEHPSAASVKAVLMHTATDMYPGQYGEVGESNGQELLEPGPNANQGYGRVDMDSATNNQYEVVDSQEGVNQGESHTVSVDSRGGELKVTLVYTDAPGAASAAVALVNDLDLEVTLSDGRVLKSESRINNSEQLVIDDLPAGSHTIAVVGHSVPQGHSGRQPYALVLSY